jgi:glyoxylase-like metal-dependent hydrolase (beta-lactamase superfamily II)
MLRLILAALLVVAVRAADIPEWCKALPRPEYKALKRVPAADPWFEVYEVRPGVFAIYEPHQFEEVISYLIAGNRRAILFDTGMGIGDMRRTVRALTALPITVLNSHTHNDHVGDNWQFDDVRNLDTAFTRTNAKGSREDAQAELAPDDLCTPLPAGFDAAAYCTRPWHIAGWIHDGDRIDLGGRTIEVLATPGHTPDEISLLDWRNGLLFTGDTYYPAPIWLYRPETDLAAYESSLRRLTALAPQVNLLLTSHNVPTAAPAALSTVLDAFLDVRAGKVAPVIRGDDAIYTVNSVTFRMHAPGPAPRR